MKEKGKKLELFEISTQSIKKPRRISFLVIHGRKGVLYGNGINTDTYLLDTLRDSMFQKKKKIARHIICEFPL